MKNINPLDVVNKNFHSRVGEKYSKNDVIAVWDTVSRCVETYLQKGQGIFIKDLGTFTLSEWKINIGSNKYIQIKKPVFCLSNKLEQFFNLKSRHVYSSGKVPIEMLNFSSISASIGCSRIMVEDCITEVVQAFTKLLSNNSNTEFVFARIGKLQIRNKEVCMKFYKDFLTLIDGSSKKYITGEHLSVLSGKATPLTKYRPSDGYCSVMPVLQASDCCFKKIGSTSGRGDFSNTGPVMPNTNNTNGTPDGCCGSFETRQEQAKETKGCDTISNRSLKQSTSQKGRYKKKCSKSMEELSITSAQSMNKHSSKKSNSCCKIKVSGADKDTQGKLTADQNKDCSKNANIKSSSNSSKANSVINNDKEISGESKDPDPQLCYRCQLQDFRAFRNKPFDPDMTLLNNAKDRIVELDILKRDAGEVMKYWEKENAQKNKNKEFAQYNKLVADQKKEENMQKEVESPKAYVLCKRPDTPSKYNPQLAQDLKEMITIKNNHMLSIQGMDNEREQQKHLELAKELESQRWANAHEQDRIKREYRQALDLQIKSKQDYHKMFPEDTAVPSDTRGVPLGFRDLEEQHRKAMEYRKFQEYQAECKKAKERKEQEQLLEDEKLWLKELDGEAKKERMYKSWKHNQKMQELEQSWEKTHAQKLEREQEEAAYRGNPSYLLEEIIPRCRRCKKKLGFPPQKVT